MLLGRWISEVTRIAEIKLFFFIHFITSTALVFVFFASFPIKTQQSNKLIFSVELLGIMIFLNSFFFTMGLTPEMNIFLE